jgi:putative hemolysin
MTVQPKAENPAIVMPTFEHLALETLTLKIAETPEEIIAAQELRYQVFYQEMGAIPTVEMKQLGREVEAYDPFCQHLLVIDQSDPVDKKIVGTYRLLLLDDARAKGVNLYTET